MLRDTMKSLEIERKTINDRNNVQLVSIGQRRYASIYIGSLTTPSVKESARSFKLSGYSFQSSTLVNCKCIS